MRKRTFLTCHGLIEMLTASTLSTRAAALTALQAPNNPQQHGTNGVAKVAAALVHRGASYCCRLKCCKLVVAALQVVCSSKTTAADPQERRTSLQVARKRYRAGEGTHSHVLTSLSSAHG